MARHKLTPGEREAIVRGLNQGVSHKELEKIFGVGRTTIVMCWKRYSQRKSFCDAPRSGRPPTADERCRRAIKFASLNDATKTGVEIRAEMEERGKTLTVDTVNRCLRKFGLFGRRPARKPFVSLKNRRTRIDFAKAHLDWTVEDWGKVLFSDESKFLLHDSRVQYVRRPVGERFNPKYMMPTVKHGGGSVMVWGAFSANGIGPLRRIEGKMTGATYREILDEVMLPFAKRSMPPDFTFQQDNDPKHSCKLVKKWFEQQKLKVLDWPAQSPDLNPIEHLWEGLKSSCAGIRVKNESSKFKLLQSKWSAITQETISTLIVSMPDRMKAVIDSKGYPTKY